MYYCHYCKKWHETVTDEDKIIHAFMIATGEKDDHTS